MGMRKLYSLCIDFFFLFLPQSSLWQQEHCKTKNKPMTIYLYMESYNISSWKGPTRITKRDSLLLAGLLNTKPWSPGALWTLRFEAVPIPWAWACPLWGKNLLQMSDLTAHLLFSILFIDVYTSNPLKLHLSNRCNIASPQCKVSLNTKKTWTRAAILSCTVWKITPEHLRAEVSSKGSSHELTAIKNPGRCFPKIL